MEVAALRQKKIGGVAASTPGYGLAFLRDEPSNENGRT